MDVGFRSVLGEIFIVLEKYLVGFMILEGGRRYGFGIFRGINILKFVVIYDLGRDEFLGFED